MKPEYEIGDVVIYQLDKYQAGVIRRIIISENSVGYFLNDNDYYVDENVIIKKFNKYPEVYK